MSGAVWWKLCTAPGPLAVGKGYSLRVLTAQEVLEARREAVGLAREGREQALCANACLLARALRRRGRRVFPSGQAVLERMTVEQIQDLAGRWAAFCREEDPGFGLEKGKVDALKKSLEHAPQERLRWRVLRAFRALPTEERVKAMGQREYLWCALNLLLDEEEAAALLCPACRAEAERRRCPVCGKETGEISAEENPGFDMERFLQLKEEAGT